MLFIFASEKSGISNMGKTVILAKNAQNGLRKVFPTCEEAAKMLGVSSASVSAATVDVRETRGWIVRRVERVYALHIKRKDEWVLANVNSKGGFVEFGNPARRISAAEYDEVRDITVGWYLQDSNMS
jgi:hypothetical protein